MGHGKDEDFENSREEKEMEMTKEHLESYRKLMQDIRLLREELNEMRSSEAGLGSSVVFDYRKGYPRPQAVVGFDDERYDRKQKLLEKKIEQTEKIRGWIEAIEEPGVRAVFRYYYLDGLTWQQVALKLGYRDNPDYPRLHIRDKWLREKGVN